VPCQFATRRLTGSNAYARHSAPSGRHLTPSSSLDLPPASHQVPSLFDASRLPSASVCARSPLSSSSRPGALQRDQRNREFRACAPGSWRRSMRGADDVICSSQRECSVHRDQTGSVPKRDLRAVDRLASRRTDFYWAVGEPKVLFLKGPQNATHRLSDFQISQH
jgi:hypothetical protein